MSTSSKLGAAAQRPERRLFPGEIELHDLAAEVNRTPKTVRRWIAEGKLPRPCRRIGDLVYLDLAQINRMRERQPDRRRRRKAS
jgi:hypothetical protein